MAGAEEGVPPDTELRVEAGGQQPGGQRRHLVVGDVQHSTVQYSTVQYSTAPPPGCGRCPARASARQPATQTMQTRLSSVGSVKHQSWIFCPDGVRRGTLAGEQLSLTDLLSSKMILISCLLFVCLFYLVKSNYRPIVHS